MGVEVDFYVVYGVKLSYDECKDFCAEHGDNEKGVDAVIDHMSGDYAVIGKILAKMSEYDDSGDNVIEFGAEYLEDVEKNYRKQFEEKFPDHVGLLNGEHFRLIFIKHYS